MFQNYQFPGMAFHAMQWPGVGVTSESTPLEEFLTNSERRDLLLLPVIR